MQRFMKTVNRFVDFVVPSRPGGPASASATVGDPHHPPLKKRRLHKVALAKASITKKLLSVL
jgi:hypothetical protein